MLRKDFKDRNEAYSHSWRVFAPGLLTGCSELSAGYLGPNAILF